MNKLIKLLCGGMLLSACAQLHSAEWTDLTKTGGEGLFGENCGMCHRANGMGTGILARRLDPEQALLENRRDLQPDFSAELALAGDPVALTDIRDHLWDNRRDLPLFDNARFTADWSALVERMVERWQQGLAPAALPAM